MLFAQLRAGYNSLIPWTTPEGRQAMTPAPQTPPFGPPPAPSPEPGWPRSAQLATAFLLGVAGTLLTVQLLATLRGSHRPTEINRTHPIDLNLASRGELLQLPGVGVSMVERIEEYRREQGGFTCVEDLLEVPGVGPATLQRLRPWIRVSLEEDAFPGEEVLEPIHLDRSDPAPRRSSPASKKSANLAQPIDINLASVEELQRLPGIGPRLSQRIVDERGRAPFRSVEDLRRVSGIGPKTIEKLRPFISLRPLSEPGSKPASPPAGTS